MRWLMTATFSLLLAGPGAAQDSAPFDGVWNRDPERSDDPQEKMQAAMEKMRQQMSGRGGGGSGRRGGGQRRGGRQGTMPNLAEITDELNLELSNSELHVDNGERLNIYYLDGEKHKRELSNGMELETTAERKGNAVVIAEKMERGNIDRKFELSPDGATLIMTITLKLGRMDEPVVIRSIYDRGE